MSSGTGTAPDDDAAGLVAPGTVLPVFADGKPGALRWAAAGSPEARVPGRRFAAGEDPGEQAEQAQARS